MVIIKDFKMPESCADCDLCYDCMECSISYGPKFWRGRPENDEFDFCKERYPDCPLLEWPSANVQHIRHGRWIKTNNPNYSPFDSSQTYNAICSNCFYTSNQTYNYCPNCGARMDGDIE